MTDTEKFLEIAGFYENMLELQSAICVRLGGVPLENYPGRFFAADVLELLNEYGARVKDPSSEISQRIERYAADFEKVKDLATPSQKPIYEMTLDEFEKVMNIK